MKLNVTLDERFVDNDKVWPNAQRTFFDFYDYISKTAIPLNYVADDLLIYEHI